MKKFKSAFDLFVNMVPRFRGTLFDLLYFLSKSYRSPQEFLAGFRAVVDVISCKYVLERVRENGCDVFTVALLALDNKSFSRMDDEIEDFIVNWHLPVSLVAGNLHDARRSFEVSLYDTIYQYYRRNFMIG